MFQDIFEAAVPPYQKELDRCGYKYKLEYKPRNEAIQTKKKWKKTVTWFNPPYSMNVATNVGRNFLTLHSVINRSTVKVGYRCLPNMGAQISRHNSKILRSSNETPKRAPPSCNCQKSKKKQS